MRLFRKWKRIPGNSAFSESESKIETGALEKFSLLFQNGDILPFFGDFVKVFRKKSSIFTSNLSAKYTSCKMIGGTQ